MMSKNAKIYVSGHAGMVGNATVNLLRRSGYKNLILITSEELDLRDQKRVDAFMKKEAPEYVFHFAAMVGGIKSNIDHPAEFLYDNLMIAENIIHSSYRYKVRKLLYLGSSCIYPRNCHQPMKEGYLLTGKFEPTNEGYALAKIIGLKLCGYYNKQFATNFICLMPPNLYGPNDNFSLDTSHVVASLIRKFAEAKLNNINEVEVWGTGKARREFLYIDDLADACLYFMNHYDAVDLPPFINIGYGKDVTIITLAAIIKRAFEYKGKIVWNNSMPEGIPQKLLDITLAKKFHWEPKNSLEEGIKKTIAWYKDKYCGCQRD